MNKRNSREQCIVINSTFLVSLWWVLKKTTPSILRCRSSGHPSFLSRCSSRRGKNSPLLPAGIGGEDAEQTGWFFIQHHIQIRFSESLRRYCTWSPHWWIEWLLFLWRLRILLCADRKLDAWYCHEYFRQSLWQFFYLVNKSQRWMDQFHVASGIWIFAVSCLKISRASFQKWLLYFLDSSVSLFEVLSSSISWCKNWRLDYELQESYKVHINRTTPALCATLPFSRVARVGGENFPPPARRDRRGGCEADGVVKKVVK